MDFEVQKFTRRCAASDRELAAGEVFYSALIADGAEVLRQDFSEDQWKGPPEKSLGWWKSEVPDPKANRLHWAPNDVMLHYFRELQNQDHKRDVAYILALLMLRRRIFKLEASETTPEGHEVMMMYCPRAEEEYQVLVCHPTESQAAAIQSPCQLPH